MDAAGDSSSGGGTDEPDPAPRPVPDFVLLGATKAGSTTLFRRLEQHPEVLAGGAKEPNFFSREENYAKGIGWYRSVLPQGSRRPSRRSLGRICRHPACTPLVVRRLLKVSSPEVRLCCGSTSGREAPFALP